ncbi:MAG: DUF5686 and carboxypeptidase regulatory-like domain-containing protein [Prevotellaceae bacterium]|nr:DUF5686 and carboxypeptidase regulatory-like domain-containing protein [Prevotellaceae bacterium]
MRRLQVFILLLLTASAHLSAQLITGTVTDSEYGDPLPGVYVYFTDDKNTLVSTDINGNYKIAARKGDLLFSMVGYDSQVIAVEGAMKLNVKLVESAHALNEVEVERKRQKYSRKNNPAVEMMRKVIAAKKGSDLRSKDYFSYKKYEKMTMALNDFTDKVFEDDHFKRFPFLREHVELYPETGKLILPLTIEERVSHKIFRKEPKAEKTIVIGERSEGVTDIINTGDILTGMMDDVFQDVDIYEDNVRLFQYPFTSPISSGEAAIRFYRYFIADTLYLDKQKCFKIDFTPNNQQDFGFSGSLYVLADSTWRIKRAVLNVPPKSDVNFVEQLDITQDFESLPTGEQVVVNNKMVVQLRLASWIHRMQVERVAKYSDFDFSVISDRMFKFKGPKKLESSAQMRDETFWEENRPVPLSQGESQMDLFMRRLQEIKGFKYVLWVAKAFIENFVETSIDPKHPSKVDIGPVNTMIGSNFVEGLRLRVSAQTTANLNKHFFMRGNLKYGFGDERWKGLGEVTYSFNEKGYLPREYPVRNITFSYENDVMSPSDKFVPTDKDNVFVAWKWTTVKHMNYFERYNMLFDWEVENGLRFNVQLRNERDEGAGHLFYQTLANGAFDANDDWGPSQENSLIQRLTFTEVMFSVKFQPGATYINTKQRRLPTNYDSPIMSISHTVGLWGASSEEHPYNFTEATLYKRFWLNSLGKIDCMIKGGIQWNKVPYPFLCMPAANLSYIMEDYTFNLIDNMEFLNDRYASLMLSWDLNGKILNRIPLVKKLKWREYVGCNMLWGTLTDKNNPFLEQNYGSDRLFFFPGNYRSDGTFQYISHVMDKKKPYVELIVGIHNIFKIFHVEYVHRVNYIYANTQKWGIRVMFRVTF